MKALLAIGLALAFGSAPHVPAAAPARRFDAPGQRHAEACVRLGAPRAPLRFADGRRAGVSVNSDAAARRACPRGRVRVDLHELLPSPAGLLAFHNGGRLYRDADSAAYGAVALPASAAATLPAPVAAGGGRGAPCTLANTSAYRVQVEAIPKAMHYKRPQALAGSNAGASFAHYGDPGAPYGARYTYLLWSFVDVHGGGMARALLAPGELVRVCDVRPLKVPAWDSRGARDGSVTARYVRVLAGSCPLYGWMIWSHRFHGRPAVAHARATLSAAPPDPSSDPRCPVAPAAGLSAASSAASAPVAGRRSQSRRRPAAPRRDRSAR